MELTPSEQSLPQRAAIVHEVDLRVIDVLTAATFEEALHTLALQARLTIGAHQCAISYVPLGDFHAAIHTHSFSDKYAKYNTYDVMPTGKGIWGVVVREKKAVFMTAAELVGHPLWANFSDLKDARGLEHPPMRGWLAVPILRPNSELLGVLQLSDKYDDADFGSADLDLLIHLAHMVRTAFDLHYVNQQLAKRTDDLQRSRDEMEQRVRDRTAELATANQSLRDEIRERTRAEQERRNLEAQVQHAQKLESLGVLAGGIAHDFNNLLTSILGYSDLAKLALPLGSSPRNFIDEVIKGARRAAELTQQMLAYSGKGQFVVQPLSLSGLVEDMGRLLEISISKKCVVQYHFMTNLPACEADPAQMRQIIMNLIINASEAIGDRSGVIAVSTGVLHCDRAYLSETYLDEKLPEGLYVYLEVTDTGCGMSEATRAKVFDPFFTTKFTGRGLGLAAVLGIVRGHRGAIKVYSELNKGTTFKVLFPATTGPVTLGPAQQGETTAWRGSGVALIVDDEEAVRGLARQMMGTMGFTVLTAADGREGVEVFRQESERIRLVLLDMTMPHLDGEETFREMRRIRSGVPTILSSGYNEQTATNRFAGKGLAAFIQKPYQYQQLLEVVRKALAER